MEILGRDFSERSSPAYSTAWAEQVMEELEAHLPRMRRECSALEFWQWLNGEADSAQRCLPTDERKREVKLRIADLVKEQLRTQDQESYNSLADDDRSRR